MIDDTDELDNELVARLRLAVMRLARRLRQESAEGITPSQLSALSVVDRQGPIALGHLADTERVQPPTMTRIAAHLEEAGLVRRTCDPGDRRSTLIETTAAGRRFVQRNRRQKDAFLHGRLVTLTRAQQEKIGEVSALLEQLIEDA